MKLAIVRQRYTPFGGAERFGCLVEKPPVFHPVAAGEDELGFGHRNRCRVHRHRAQVFDTRQTARDGCG